MNINYSKIDTLEDIVVEASSIEQNQSSFNNILSYEFNVNIIKKELSDVTSEAQMWAEEKCPKELYINHGSYIKDGLEHIINELRNKPSSNRALFSLISQKDISGSGDNAIPSFMIFQTSIEDDILYCTTYFRALEVSKFLRINIEEIRLKLSEIYRQLPNFAKVRLVIFAFRGYNNPNISPLKKSRIDLMHAIDIYKILEDKPNELYDLIKEKAQESTIIELQPLIDMEKALNVIPSEKAPSNIILIKCILAKSIKYGEELSEARTKHSHHDLVDQKKSEFSESLYKLANEFNK